MIDIAKDQEIKKVNSIRKINKIKRDTPKNKPLSDKLIKEANRNNAEVIDNGDFDKVFDRNPRNFQLNISNELKTAAKNELSGITNPLEKKVYKALSKGDSIIGIVGKAEDNSAIIAHELGHHINKEKLPRKILNKLEDKDGIINSVLKRIVIPKEERAANKTAIKLLKKNNATKEEIDNFKKMNKEALKTHKRSDNVNILSNVYQKVQIPSHSNKISIAPDRTKIDEKLKYKEASIKRKIKASKKRKK